MPKFVIVSYAEDTPDWKIKDELDLMELGEVYKVTDISTALSILGYTEVRQNELYDKLEKIAVFYANFSGGNDKGTQTAKVRLESAKVQILIDIARSLSYLMETVP